MKQADPAAFTAARPHAQYGALCWRQHRDEVQVLLITSRETGRWLIPKGWPMKGRPAHEAARIEAWEEAGVIGTAGAEPIGVYAYAKGRAPETLRSCAVAVYPLQVTGLARRFPETGQRRRKWFSLAKAARKVAEPDLAALIAGFTPPPPAGPAPLDSALPRGHIQ
ncbi:NUDIX hydrolase [Gemmobacter sp.]|uniref:NUDIX hydrolase n=1 Tax=Gemmobacter sp. TaxID=1898957 RepID=UPI002AFF0A6E|nr:NUDIX hydrolase [Gemmobacter sp.]